MRNILIALLLFSGAYAEDIKQVSEAMGHIIGKNLFSLGVDLDLDAIVKGLKEESEGKGSPLSDEECIKAVNNLQEEKITTVGSEALESADAISNGDLVHDESDSISTADSSKYR